MPTPPRVGLGALRPAQLRLLMRLADATRGLEDPDAIVAAGMAMLREHLGADRCVWAEVEADEDHFVFLGTACAPGVPDVSGRFPVSAFGDEALASLRSGRSFVVHDARTDLPRGALREAYAATGIVAIAAVPIHRSGRFVAGTGVHMLSPRRWSEAEVVLLEEVTRRCWEALERARVTRRLAASEARNARTLEAIGEAMVSIGRDWRYAYVNAKAGEILGREPSDLLGRHVWTEFPRAVETPTFDAHHRVMVGGPPERVEVFDPWTDRWYENRIYPAPDGVLTFFVDITARKAAEAERERLLESERVARAQADAARSRLQAILDGAPAAVFVKDRAGRFELVNEAFLQLFDQDRDRVIGRSDAEFHPPEIAASVIAHDRDVWSSGERRGFDELVQSSAGPRHYRSEKFLLRDAAGEPVALCGIAMDVTELTTSRRALQEADHRKNEFIAMLSHELRNPLAPLRTALRVLEREPLSESGRQAAELGSRQLRQLARLVDDLLEVSRITQGKIELRLEDVMLQRIVYEVADSLRPALDERGVHLEFDLPARPVTLRADPVRLAQIVENLLTNASKY
ncbi:MAG TPA: PAS domain-containing protein, partial [Burkholderiaceae bacterium]|nr:PAS domain-containing protein [Burkholderiaceae bacterium]